VTTRPDHKTGNVTYNVTLRCVHVSIVVMGKQYYKFECESVALVLQHAKRMRSLILLFLDPIYHIFLYYLINSTIFKKDLLNIKCVF